MGQHAMSALIIVVLALSWVSAILFQWLLFRLDREIQSSVRPKVRFLQALCLFGLVLATIGYLMNAVVLALGLLIYFNSLMILNRVAMGGRHSNAHKVPRERR